MSYVDVGEWFGREYPPGAVVVGYNGREHSRATLAWAADEAVRRGAPLLVLYAANYPGMTVEPGPGLLHREPGALEAAQEVTARGVSEALEAHPDLRIVGATEVTSPSRALIEAGRSASVLVLGSRGYGRVVGTLLGSVAFNVAARAPCPVVVVKDDATDRVPGPRFPIVVGTDGSPEAEDALRFAGRRASVASAPLHVVTSTGGRQVGSVDEGELHATAARIAASAAARALADHPELEVSTRVDDCPAERTLIDLSAAAGLVVVGTRGRGAFEGLLLGSVSHAVVHGAESAVAVV